MSEAAVLEAPIPVNPSPAAAAATAATNAAPQPAAAPAPAKLIRPRDEAVALIKKQVERGAEIKALRIRNGPELDQARAAKLEWTTQCIELLNSLFDSTIVAEQCNDWVGRIFPEYAEFGNFVEQFYTEMDHRLGRLKGVMKRVERMRLASKAPAKAAAAANGAAQAPAAESTGVVVEPPRLQQLDMAGLLVVRKVDESLRQAVAEFLESLDIDISIAEQTQDMADLLDRNRQVQFAVILSGEPHSEHGFELGFCAGRLGINRVIVLDTQTPPAVDGAQRNGAQALAHIAVDSTGGWHLQLARQLKRSGMAVDLNRLC